MIVAVDYDDDWHNAYRGTCASLQMSDTRIVFTTDGVSFLLLFCQWEGTVSYVNPNVIVFGLHFRRMSVQQRCDIMK